MEIKRTNIHERRRAKGEATECPSWTTFRNTRVYYKGRDVVIHSAIHYVPYVAIKRVNMRKKRRVN